MNSRRKTAAQFALPFEPPAKPDEPRAEAPQPQPQASSGTRGFVGFDEGGCFMHYCHCGAWGAFGHGVSLKNGKLGRWFCREHKPQPGDQR